MAKEAFVFVEDLDNITAYDVTGLKIAFDLKALGKQTWGKGDWPSRVANLYIRNQDELLDERKRDAIFVRSRLKTFEPITTTPEDCVHYVLALTPIKRKHTETSSSVSGRKGQKRRTSHHIQEPLLQFIRNAPPPSVSAQPSIFMSRQKKDFAVLNGRPADKIGPSTTLYFEGFGQFLEELARPSHSLPEEFSAEELHEADKLMGASVNFYETEQGRRNAMEPPMDKLLGGMLVQIKLATGATGTGSIIAPCFSSYPYQIITAAVEWDNELASGESDAGLQAQLTMEKDWAEERMALVRMVSCCPSVLLSVVGPYIQISAMVHLDATVVEPLTDYITLQRGSDCPQSIRRICHIFACIRRLLHTLHEHYKHLKLPPTKPTGQHSPDGHSVSSQNDNPYLPCHTKVGGKHLTYKGALEGYPASRHIFEAELDGQPVVVKFTASYSAEAHRILANAGLAPPVLYFERIPGGLFQVVMSFIQGSTLYDYLTDHQPSPKSVQNIISKTEEGLVLLHRAGYVFGDLRTPNLMLPDSGGFMFIDWDMAGREGVPRWPPNLNREIFWPEGVKNGGFITQANDLAMLELLRHEI
ncbi:hypothetical protein DACRYDRAFT_113030 [Dacryopinax primogenitus]|uniref:Protein kinase domain-containing protein n=1 Tax=Dacryopinax primogenitus (strain DJM 731) TaxID=1858805 RepID=M5GBH1_DACPD|nr:uncharacterized protein DACRYDRAFT_113030 [Dacryopinax primogenitus]EJU06304.1 hypothetical protein DACRYDRAFT_113030 [Dacryopinax primogenitus]